MNQKYKVVFLGTGWESVESLKVLRESKWFEVVAVITAGDKPVGREQVLTPSEVKRYALSFNIPVIHTAREEKNYLKVIEKYKPDIVVCKAFGEIIPKSFLESPKYGCINIHFSLLPKYRGAVPIQKAILEGEKETGITIMLMSEGLDEGEILAQYKEKILPKDSNLTLRQRLVLKSADILEDVLIKWIHGEIESKKQREEDATYCWQKDISKENAEIKWDLYTPEYIERMVRAFLPWPIAWCKLSTSLKNSNIRGKIVKLFDISLEDISSEKDPGGLFTYEKKLYFATIDPHISIRVNELQIEGKNKMKEKEFLNGLGKEIP